MAHHNLRAEKNCLSLDGGGVRSLSSLLILEEIVRQYNITNGLAADDQPPGNVFHVAFGTSGGGLSALMIKKYAMPMQACINSLRDVSNTVFQRRAAWPNLDLGALTGGLLVGSRFSQGLLRQQIQLITGTRTQMQNPSSNCNCYVVCRRSNSAGRIIDNRAVCFACFANGQANRLVWEAALATSAASTYFPPAQLGPLEYYIDGGLGFNNPILTFSKQKSFMGIGDRMSACIISIGTGEPTSVQNQTARNSWWRFWDRLTIINVFQNALALATDIKNDHDAFEEIAGLSSNWSYFRFNCGGGLADIPLDQASQLPTIENLTRAYLAKPQTQAMIQDALRA
ncbi:FabD/lysophospholipase-like protein [Aspergillus aculeatinus CBS 121060]|uniref:FabD/lysophospholipase-like protein n=1 Tax=Aspergillus aculeatinus CBS 121060 TaxID=1448322 RepID=A0ACD1H2Z4_9EURO|nr:FabD/lysophospholipase-like protein [Aspergillus aculeatinus CBS 121060]RAH67948.1 FabD/lysophospholipase-like protein [Aspergillus aculeatinus CBS 121060]